MKDDEIKSLHEQIEILQRTIKTNNERLDAQNNNNNNKNSVVIKDSDKLAPKQLFQEEIQVESDNDILENTDEDVNEEEYHYQEEEDDDNFDEEKGIHYKLTFIRDKYNS